jgi:PAS domain S-box-containing protein
VGTFEWFPETGKVVVSDEYRRIFGIAPQTEITADHLVGLLHPEDRPLSGAARLARENPLEYAEYRITRPDTGEVRWIARRGEVVRTAERTPRRFVGVAFDITQRKQIEEQLRDTNERLSALFNQTAVGISQTDLDGTIVLANDRFCEILGRGRDDVLGRHVIDLTHPDDRARSAEMFATLLESAAPFFIEKRYLRPDGSSVWVSNYVSLAKPVQGGPRYVSRIVVDITERRHAEEALRAQRDAGAACGRRSGGALQDRGGIAPIAEDGGGGPVDRRHRARLQQSAAGDHRLARAHQEADRPGPHRRG